MNYTWCKVCGDPSHSKAHICAQCEEESAMESVRKYEAQKYSFSKHDFVGKNVQKIQKSYK